MNESSFPLSWPLGWQRVRPQDRLVSRFGTSYSEGTSVARAVEFLCQELGRLEAENPVISTNLTLRIDGFPRSNNPQPIDPGAAVYFTLKKKRVALACDKWMRVQCNIWAIAKHVEALRGQERWGVGSLEQAFRGYMALPDLKKPWRVVFGVEGNPTQEELKALYLKFSKIHHPDAGGSSAAMAEINAAFDEAKEEYGL